MSHIYVHTDSFLPHLTMSLAPSQRSSQVHNCHLIVPFSSPMLFLSVSVLHIGQAHQRMFVCAGFVVPDSFWWTGVLYLGLPCVLALGRVLLLYIRLLKLLLMFPVPILFSIFTDGEIWSPSTSLWLCYSWTGVWLVRILGFNLYCRWLGICRDVVVVLMEGGIGQSFLISKRLPDIFPALGHGVPAWTGASSRGGGYFLKLGVTDSLDLLGPFLGMVAQLHCLDQAWPLLLLFIS